jgi:hypothetical protein
LAARPWGDGLCGCRVILKSRWCVLMRGQSLVTLDAQKRAHELTRGGAFGPAVRRRIGRRGLAGAGIARSDRRILYHAPKPFGAAAGESRAGRLGGGPDKRKNESLTRAMAMRIGSRCLDAVARQAGQVEPPPDWASLLAIVQRTHGHGWVFAGHPLGDRDDGCRTPIAVNESQPDLNHAGQRSVCAARAAPYRAAQHIGQGD